MTTTATHPDADAFLRAIAAEPAEDTPRLAFADWLDEHGDGARAEFIRLQCLLAAHSAVIAHNAPEPVYTPQLRERELLARNRRAWLAAGPCARCHGTKMRLSSVLDRDRDCRVCFGTGDRGGLLRAGCEVAFVRGWPERVTVPALGWLVEVEEVSDFTDAGEVVTHEVEPSRWLRSVLEADAARGLIAEVVPACRVPAKIYSLTDFGWWDNDEVEDEDDPSNLPNFLFECVWESHPSQRYYPAGGTRGVRIARFDTAALAIAALGRTVCRWARASLKPTSPRTASRP